jgi:transcriptional regulator GlxA family with amidase domain
MWPLRTRAATFDTRGSGQLAIALLTPLGLLRAFAYPLDSLTDQRLLLRDLASAQPESTLHAALLDAALGRWLEQRIAQGKRLGPQAERVAGVAIAMLECDVEGIAALHRRHRVGRRQLERDFRHWLGVAPGAYARLLRFQRSAMAVADGRR